MSNQWRRGGNGCWESDDITVWTTTRMIDDSNKADQASPWWRGTTVQWQLSREDISKGANIEYGVAAADGLPCKE